MRLEAKQATSPVHTDLASGCGWSVWNELFTCSDDQSIQKWSTAGEPEGKVRPAQVLQQCQTSWACTYQKAAQPHRLA